MRGYHEKDRLLTTRGQYDWRPRLGKGLYDVTVKVAHDKPDLSHVR